MSKKYLQLNDFLKDRIIEEVNAVGYHPTEIVQNLKKRGYKVSKSTVIRWWKRYCQSGTTERMGGSGRPKKIMPAVLAAVQAEMARNGMTTAKELPVQITE